jgi:RHS repeat-associated protein
MTTTKLFGKILIGYLIIISHSVQSQITQPLGIVKDIIKVEGVTDPSQIGSIGANDHLVVHKYVDGFGRPLETIFIGASPDNSKDLIQFYKYDEFGRKTQQYLPFAYTAASSPYQDASTVLTNQASFYNTTGAKIATDTKPWMKTEIEESPMQRMLKKGDVGDGFQTNQHYKTVLYRTNTSAADGSIRVWSTTGTSSSSYSDNDLTVTEAAEENGYKSITFFDKFGRLILKRRQADETINSTTYAYFDTYYVYDLLGNLSYIVPPKAAAKLASLGGTLDVGNVSNLTFHYVYDAKNRVIIKKLPNKSNIYIVYDPLDRVVLTQDGYMRASNKWTYLKYDNANRVIVSGIYTDATHNEFNTGTSSDMQVYVNGLACYLSSSTTYYELRTTGTFSWYTNNCFPTSGTEERLINYYDDYDFNNDGSADYSYSAQGLPGEQSSGATNRTLGFPAGSRKKILGTSNWLISYVFYDKWYHPIQVTSNSILKLSTVSDLTTVVVDIAGRVTAKRTFKSHSQGAGFSITVNNVYTYDKMDRQLEVKQANNSESQIIVGHYEYNAIGQLVDKKLHSNNGGSSYLQSVDYRYNIRGQLTSINNSTLSNDGGITNDESNDVFGMEILYENTDALLGNTANYTGLVSAVKWKAATPSPGNTDQRAYLFSYDKLHRLKDAAYKAFFYDSWSKDVDGFNENVSYEWNGNITNLQRNAIVSGYTGPQQIDNLSYDYGTGNDNNQLASVAENSTNANAALGFKTLSSSSYQYDANGNLVTDPKKGTTITYNELGKAVHIDQPASPHKYIEYGYDASGLRVTKTVYDGSTTKTIYYIDNFVFSETYAVSYFFMEEGRLRPGTKGNYKYEYFIRDQLGNVRVSFEDNGGTASVIQENSYYPFGMTMPGNYLPTAPNKNLYNAGSEWQDDYDIANYYSTFFREYDPILARFNSIDLLADYADDASPYHYSGNNPVSYNDPLGLLAGAVEEGDPPDGGGCLDPEYMDDDYWAWFNYTTGSGSGGGGVVSSGASSSSGGIGFGVWNSVLSQLGTGSSGGGYTGGYSGGGPSAGGFYPGGGGGGLPASVPGTAGAGSPGYHLTLGPLNYVIRKLASDDDIYSGIISNAVSKKPDLPFTDDEYNSVYNDRQPYHDYKPCDDPFDNGHVAENQCTLRASKGFRDLGVKMPKATWGGIRCAHNDFRMVSEFRDALKKRYRYIEIRDPKRNGAFIDWFKQLLSDVEGSAFIVLTGFWEEDDRGQRVLGNHIEFVYKGTPKSDYYNIWYASNIVIFFFKE